MKRPKKKERQDRILTELRLSAAIRIPELAESFQVSTETIRRDLEEMAAGGLIMRTYGGAVVSQLGVEPGWMERDNLMVAERERIGGLAEQFVRAREIVMIDAGSTTLHLARRLALAEKEITVITNCYAVAMALGTNPRIAVHVCPGRHDPHEGGVTGTDTVDFINRFHADRTFIGASGITAEGVNEANAAAAAVKRAMLRRAETPMLLLDHAKFDRVGFERVCRLPDLRHLVSDQAPDGDLGAALARARVQVHLASAIGAT
jgi:DeoR/GlpR family transcriptional regulator of sugar metabolism